MIIIWRKTPCKFNKVNFYKVILNFVPVHEKTFYFSSICHYRFFRCVFCFENIFIMWAFFPFEKLAYISGVRYFDQEDKM